MTRTLRIDPHVHTRFSYDSSAPVEAVLEHAAAAGLDGLVVTDHDAIEGSRLAVEQAGDFGLVALPGVEVSTAHGHLLALGVTERPDPHRPLGETIDAVRDAGGVAVVPHPFRRTSHGVRRSNLTDPDAVETFNACTLLSYRNRQAAAYADRNELPGIGSSDAHTPSAVGDGFTTVEVADSGHRTDVDPVAILDGIRAGRTTAHGNRASVRRYLNKYAVNAWLAAARR
ncbi:CehA/McbA family metallohydrolase [Haloarchaeobius sp. DT45]|uniref:CehA/McbA family metallohydrolase n=1 Tax=Haloarchaeobius sp. DT45 TaxID=3446116 RepID=UPI003F6BFFEA